VLALLAACSPPPEDAARASLTLAGPQVEAVSIDPARELVITDVSVVDDALSTTWVPDRSDGDPEGAWSFGRLVDGMVGPRMRTPWGRSQFVLHWLRSWERDQVVNGFRVPARPKMRAQVTEPWRQASGCAGPDVLCTLDFTKAPLRLLAIVYRPDLRRVPVGRVGGHAGQGRFVFGVLGPNGERTPFTLILEYQLPARSQEDILQWARRWHALGGLPFGPEYNARLRELTAAFSGRDAVPGRRNGSALLQLRTNEVSLTPVEPRLWEMREFVLGPHGLLVHDPVENEPDASFNGSPELGRWVERHADAILAGRHEVPRRYRGRPFLAGASPVPLEAGPWQVPGAPEDVRRAFSEATCGGCHKAETDTDFLHLRNRDPGKASRMSDYLLEQLAPTGTRVRDYQSLLEAPDASRVGDGPGRDHGGTHTEGDGPGEGG
jgi:hypothetical protein